VSSPVFLLAGISGDTEVDNSKLLDVPGAAAILFSLLDPGDSF